MFEESQDRKSSKTKSVAAKYVAGHIYDWETDKIFKLNYVLGKV